MAAIKHTAINHVKHLVLVGSRFSDRMIEKIAYFKVPCAHLRKVQNELSSLSLIVTIQSKKYAQT